VVGLFCAFVFPQVIEDLLVFIRLNIFFVLTWLGVIPNTTSEEGIYIEKFILMKNNRYESSGKRIQI
jgi:hypothetical protein